MESLYPHVGSCRLSLVHLFRNLDVSIIHTAVVAAAAVVETNLVTCVHTWEWTHSMNAGLRLFQRRLWIYFVAAVTFGCL